MDVVRGISLNDLTPSTLKRRQEDYIYYTVLGVLPVLTATVGEQDHHRITTVLLLIPTILEYLCSRIIDSLFPFNKTPVVSDIPRQSSLLCALPLCKCNIPLYGILLLRYAKSRRPAQHCETPVSCETALVIIIELYLYTLRSNKPSN